MTLGILPQVVNGSHAARWEASPAAHHDRAALRDRTTRRGRPVSVPRSFRREPDVIAGGAGELGVVRTSSTLPTTAIASVKLREGNDDHTASTRLVAARGACA